MIPQKSSPLVCILALTILAVASRDVSAANRTFSRLLQKLKGAFNSTTDQVSSSLDNRLIRMRIPEYPAGLTNASILEFPWLLTVHTDDYRDSCVGVLISSEWGLIPATCGVSFDFSKDTFLESKKNPNLKLKAEFFFSQNFQAN